MYYVALLDMYCIHYAWVEWPMINDAVLAAEKSLNNEDIK